jgi:hypothetical protein
MDRLYRGHGWGWIQEDRSSIDHKCEMGRVNAAYGTVTDWLTSVSISLSL